MAVSPGNRAAPRLPGVLNFAAGLILALVLTFFAVTARNASPPAIAEFAPTAQKPITQAPQEQTSRLGSARGGGAAGAASPAPSPSPHPPDAILRNCVGDPPRQIEDPQSPPCVPYWKGNNGGRTWSGVGPHQITIYYPDPAGEAWGGGSAPAAPALQKFFNTRFELYDRQISLVPYKRTGDTVQNQHTDAATVGSQDVYAVLPDDAYVHGSGGSNLYFNDDLARRKITTVLAWGTTTLTQDHLDQWAPYEWSFMMTIDQQEALLAEIICKDLKGKRAVYGGPKVAAEPQRKFGIIQTVTPDGTNYEIQTLETGLAGCGIKPWVTQYTSNGNETGWSTQLADAQSKGVTTITCICLGNDLNSSGWLQEADAANYEPEWLGIGISQQDNDDQGQLGAESAPDQATHRIWITGHNKRLPMEQMPFWWAVKEGDPSADARQWHGAQYYYGAYYFYEALLELLSGIQMAGPDLTPANVQRGLWTTQFPNPGADGPPLYQARVGFANHSHTMSQDVAGIWWSNTAQSQYWAAYTGGAGAWCYLDLGVRYGLGGWPRRNLDFYNGPCQ